MDGKNVWVVTAVVIVILAGIWLFTRPATAPGNTNVTVTEGENGGETFTNTTSTTTTTTTAPQSVTVTYTDAGFSPKSVSIPVGGSVTWVNQSSGKMWVATARHPDHTVYDASATATHCAAGYTGTAPFDECKSVEAGGTYTFTFTKAGSWGYHNHSNANATGMVIVTSGTTVSGSVNVQ
jgi:plastocyanin